MSKVKSTYDYAVELRHSVALAIDNLIGEIRKPVDNELSGSARKAELQSIALATTDAREMLRTLQELDETIKSLSEGGEIEDEADFGAGFAEKFSKK
jgi:hypothetical protein